MWVGVLPAFIAVILLLFFVPEAPPVQRQNRKTSSLSLTIVKHLPPSYWRVVGLGTMFTLARFSEAFLVLRAQSSGLSLGHVPLVMIVMNVAYAGFAYPAGAAADRISRKTLLLWGLGLLIVADLALAFASTPALVLAGSAFWGLHMALTQGLLSKMVADAAPQDLRGSAFGFFNFVSGGALLLASVLAGALWNAWGPSATFLAGAAFAAVTALGLMTATRAQ
jgi:MFS family permease